MIASARRSRSWRSGSATEVWCRTCSCFIGLLQLPILLEEPENGETALPPHLPLQLLHLCLDHQVNRFMGCDCHIEQRYRCNNRDCARRIFLLQYHNAGWVPEVKRQIVDMALNGSGIRDTARVLGVSPRRCSPRSKKRVRAAPGEPCSCDCWGRMTTRGGDPQSKGGGAGREVVLCRRQAAPAVAVGSAGSSDGPDPSVCLWSPRRSSFRKTQSAA